MTKMESTFEAWGLLELFGHTKLAGLLTEETIGGVHFIRIDIPKVDGTPGHTRYFTQGAIYGMSPTTEDVARRLAANLSVRPVQAYELRDSTRQLDLSYSEASDSADDCGD
jgi:hypothetical protein